MRLADLDYRNNSIGFLRLLFATLVIYSHGFGLGGFASADQVVALSANAWSFGTLAVCGFFFLSGFLVTRSYEGLRSLPRFLWHRIVRIFPGYWCCLLVMVFLFAPAVYLAEHGTLAGYWSAPPPGNPLLYLTQNYTLDAYQFQIADLFANNPFPHVINGSIWTLGNEFRAYIVVGALGVLGVITRFRAIVLAAFVALWALSAAPGFTGDLLAHHRLLLGVFEGYYPFEEMFVYFFAGATAYLYREYVPIRTPLFAIALIGTFAILPLPWFRVLMPLMLCYAILWLMCRLPLRSIDRRMDLSYGIYIYAFPVGQTLAMLQVPRFGVAAYLLLSFVATIPLAAASWFLVEAPAMRLKNARLPFITAAENGLARVAAVVAPYVRRRALGVAPAGAPIPSSRSRRAEFRVLTGVGSGLIAAAVILVVAFALSALRHGPSPDTPAPPAGTDGAPTLAAAGNAYLPAGITAAAPGSTDAPRGIYAGGSQADCCWLARTAEFHVTVANGVRRLMLHTYIPDYPYLREHPQRVHARVDGADAATTALLAPGVHDVDVALTGSNPSRTSHDVALSMDLSFEPSKIGVGNDTRELSLLLRSVSPR